MNDLNRCPDLEQLMAWMDMELEDEQLTAHIGRCQACRELINNMQQENNLLCAMLDFIPAPDLTGRVMARVEKQGQSFDSLYNIISYLVAAGVAVILILAYKLLPGLTDFEFRPVAVIEVLSMANRLMVFIGDTMKYITSEMFRGAPIIPPLVLVLALLLVNLIGKRRHSDV